MNHKFILQFLDTEGNIKKEAECKTLRDIEKILGIEYFQVRQLYLYNKKPLKRAHAFLLELVKRYKIIDNPNLMPNMPPTSIYYDN